MRKNGRKIEHTLGRKSSLAFAALIALVLGSAIALKSLGNAPLKLVNSIPLPTLHDGDFDHFALDTPGNRLFATAEENSEVEVIDLRTNKLIHSINDVKAPHSMIHRADLGRLFIVDGDLGEVRMYETTSYKNVGSIKLRTGADPSVHDPSTKYLYVVDGGQHAKLPNAYICVVDTSAARKIDEIKLEAARVEGIAIENTGPRMFIAVNASNSIIVLDRKTHAVIANWTFGNTAKYPSALAFDEANHRLFVGTRDPATLVVMDSDSGRVVTSLPAVSMVDDIAYSSQRKRIYYPGTNFIEVFQQQVSDRYTLIGRIPTAPRAKTGILSPELTKYFLAVPRHENKVAEVRVYSELP
jgi:DNA-binding beta-propeller fold protein YncE